MLVAPQQEDNIKNIYIKIISCGKSKISCGPLSPWKSNPVISLWCKSWLPPSLLLANKRTTVLKLIIEIPLEVLSSLISWQLPGIRHLETTGTSILNLYLASYLQIVTRASIFSECTPAGSALNWASAKVVHNTSISSDRTLQKLLH